MEGLKTHAVVDRFRVQAKLGQGGMGSVYKVQDLDSGEILAMKVVHPDATERFLAEARALAALAHPHVIRFHGIWPMPDGTYALLMDYIVGSDMQSQLQQGISKVEALLLLHQAALGLDYCHGKEVVHRDIKPANIMVASVDGASSALVVDFGLGKDRKLDAGATRREGAAGTPPFMGPEQARDFAHAGGKADQWSLAVTAWYCLTGDLPFADAPWSFSGRPSILSLNPTIPGEVEGIFDRAFATDEDRRYATCTDLTSQLGAAFGVDLPMHVKASRRRPIKERVLPQVPEHDFSDRHLDQMWGFCAGRLGHVIRTVAATRQARRLDVQGVKASIRVRRDSLVVELSGGPRQAPANAGVHGGSPPSLEVRELEDLGWRGPQGIARPWSLAVPVDHDPTDTADRVIAALEVAFGVPPEAAHNDL